MKFYTFFLFFFIGYGWSLAPKEIPSMQTIEQGSGSLVVEKESSPVFMYVIKNDHETLYQTKEPLYYSLKSLPKDWQKILLGMKKNEKRKVFFDPHHFLEVELLYPHIHPQDFPIPFLVNRPGLS